MVSQERKQDEPETEAEKILNNAAVVRVMMEAIKIGLGQSGESQNPPDPNPTAIECPRCKIRIRILYVNANELIVSCGNAECDGFGEMRISDEPDVDPSKLPPDVVMGEISFVSLDEDVQE